MLLLQAVSGRTDRTRTHHELQTIVAGEEAVTSPCTVHRALRSGVKGANSSRSRAPASSSVKCTATSRQGQGSRPGGELRRLLTNPVAPGRVADPCAPSPVGTRADAASDDVG